MSRLFKAAASTRVRALLCFGMILGLGTVGTLAVWSDNAAATSGVFSTGTVDLRVNELKSHDFGELHLADMLPGESIAKTLTVQNHGSVPVRYAMAASTPAGSPQLTGFLQVSANPAGTPTNTMVNGLRKGSCSGPGIGPVTLISGGSAPVLPARGPLAPFTGEESLCIVAELSTTANSAVQSQVLNPLTLDFTTTGP